jgi:hypothetical protein
MVTAPQAAIPPARKPRAAEGFFVGEIFEVDVVDVVAMVLLTNEEAATDVVVPEGRNAGGEEDESIFYVE